VIERSHTTIRRKLDFRLQLLVGASILVGLFFVEYPPMFLLGYWSWSGFVHKTITGVLLVLNLIIAQQATKRLGFFL
jgi:hypothetical protein